MFLRFTRLGIRLLVRSPLVIAVAALLALSFSLPSLIPSDTDAFVLSGEFIKENHLDILKESMEGGAYDTAPEYMQKTNQRQLELLEITQGNDQEASLRAQAEIAQLDMEMYERGNLVGEYLPLKSNEVFLTTFAKLDHPAAYMQTTQEPTLYRLAAAMHSVPVLLLLAPIFAVNFVLLKSVEASSLLRQFPLRFCDKIICFIAVSCMVSTLLVALALLFPAVISLVRNGVGDPLYPVVFIQGNLLVETTVAKVAVNGLALYALNALCISSFAAAVFMLARKAIPAVFAAVLLSLLPMVPQYFAETFPLRDLLWALPTTYFDVSAVVGFPSCLRYEDILPVAGANAMTGCIVLLACLALFTAFAAGLAHAVGDRVRRGGGRHA